MKPTPEPSAQEVLAGLVERVTYHNAENGFCVLRAKARGHRDLVTLVGHAATIAAGEWITASGEWVNDRTHGQQFKARFLRTSLPDSADGIEKYLSSGMIRGVGPVYAKKLVRAFGDKVFDVIETTPDRLREVDGIGPVRAARTRRGRSPNWPKMKNPNAPAGVRRGEDREMTTLPMPSYGGISSTGHRACAVAPCNTMQHPLVPNANVWAQAARDGAFLECGRSEARARRDRQAHL